MVYNVILYIPILIKRILKMSISFSGLASGLDTSGWVEALVSVKQEKVSALKVDLAAIKTSKTTLTLPSARVKTSASLAPQP